MYCPTNIIQVARLVTASTTAPSSATSPPTSFAVSVATRGIWLAIAQIASVAARRATSFLAKEVPQDALVQAMLSTARWRYAVFMRIPELMLTLFRTSCRNSLGTHPTVQWDISKPRLPTHGTKADTVVATLLVPGSLVLLRRPVALPHGRPANDRTITGAAAAAEVLHLGLSDKTAAAMAVTVALLALLVPLAVVLLRGSLRPPPPPPPGGGYGYGSYPGYDQQGYGGAPAAPPPGLSDLQQYSQQAPPPPPSDIPAPPPGQAPPPPPGDVPPPPPPS